ncbi:MAG: hypothetical protein PHV30_02520 [Candidatus Margulisbacteria bacterium]|nr:hypothetical protein [Candidatus Margulisiibacteriota bacterium]
MIIAFLVIWALAILVVAFIIRQSFLGYLYSKKKQLESDIKTREAKNISN